MRISLLATLFLLSCSVIYASPRGMTSRDITIEDAISVIQAPGSIKSFDLAAPGSKDISKEGWVPVWQMPLDLLLPAGAQAGLSFDPLDHSAQPYFSGAEPVLDNGYLAAVERVPDWLRARFHSVILKVPQSVRELLVDLIIFSEDIYVDEIAFCIAHSSTVYLSSPYFYPQLFVENAHKIYQIASELPYVSIVDTGSAASGGDYWSTTSYWIKDADGQMQQLTVPRDIYYWYLVQPKLTDEIAAYIDPVIVENNSTHDNNIVSPDAGGVFWRSYLYDLEDGDYPVLADTLALCSSVYNLDGSPGAAIRAATWWINQNMSFTSNVERPHQPVRIITKRFGRCGEYADLSSAVARTALIPCTSISSSSTDHTWNEFWADGWVSWEPVNGYMNNPLVYENGWGKVFGTVYEERCDGYFTPVTNRYSEGNATINIQVLDANEQPVDGARVVLAIFETTPRFDCVGYTDNEGLVSFEVGEGRDFRARAECSWGIYPAIAGTYAQLVANSEDGATYDYQFQIDAEPAVAQITELPAPNDPEDDYRIGFEYNSYQYYVSGKTIWDDIDVTGSAASYYDERELPATARLLLMDADNALFLDWDNFGSAFVVQEPSTSGGGTIDLVDNQIWYALMDNSMRTGNAVQLSGYLGLYAWSTAADDPYNPLPGLQVSQAGPNPFREHSSITIDCAAKTELEVCVYNLRGQKVSDLWSGALESGSHKISWDGKNQSGMAVASGLYLISIKGSRVDLQRKVLLIR